MGSRNRLRKRGRRSVARAEAAFANCGIDLRQPDGFTDLHEERLDTVSGILIDSGVRTVLDLGCGSGALLERLLAEERITRVVGVDASIQAVRQTERRLRADAADGSARWRVLHDSIIASNASLSGFDAAAMVEVIEHVPPERLSCVERIVFVEWSPSLVVITTPNREYNGRFGMAAGEVRHPDHCFEWCRVRFRRWANGVASRNGYELESRGVGPRDPFLGSPTQLAIFRKATGS